MSTAAWRLRTLATKRFSTLTAAEERLLDSVADGEEADYESPTNAKNDLRYADTWGPERTIRAEVLRWLCADPEASRQINPRGILIHAATIEGRLNLAYTTISVPLSLRHCAVKAGVNLVYADTRTLIFEGSILGGSGRAALNVTRAHVRGDVFLTDGFHAKGEVQLVGASIDGGLSCAKGTFHPPKGIALDAEGAHIGKGVLLGEGFHADGEVRLVGASIGYSLICTEGVFHNPTGVALDATRIEVSGDVDLRGWFRVEGEMSFENGHAGRLFDDDYFWLYLIGRLRLDGFVYTSIASGPMSATDRLPFWIDLQPARPFRPQPYLQLAKVLRESGHEADAKQVLIAKERARRKHGDLSWQGRFWNWLLWVTIRHGYQPWRALIWAGIWVAVGGGLFGRGYDKGIVIPTKAEAYDSNKKIRQEPAFYPAFNRWLYALDTFVPIINFGQKDYWGPQVACNRSGLILGSGVRLCVLGIPQKDKNKRVIQMLSRLGITDKDKDTPAIRVLYLYRWLHIAAGWVLITLVVTGFTNLVRRE
jgi:hypothetical protein